MTTTNQKTAVVTGAVAQLLQARPDMTPAQAKFVLQVTAQQLGDAGLRSAHAPVPELSAMGRFR